MPVQVVPYDPAWPEQFVAVAGELTSALEGVPVVAIEHVGSTAVPGLAAKPVLDIDVLVDRGQVAPAIAALEGIGYHHRGDLGIRDRESLKEPEGGPRRNVYVCVDGSLHVRNHLGVRDVLRRDPGLRAAYAAVKLALAEDPTMDIPRYVAGKSDILQQILDRTDLTTAEKQELYALNTDVASHREVLRLAATPAPADDSRRTPLGECPA